MIRPNMSAAIANIALEVARKAPMALATNFGSSLSAQDGGYAVPIDAASEILLPAVGALLPYCRQIPVTQGGSIRLPLDAATPYGDTGVVAEWELEAAQLTQHKPKLSLTAFTLKKLIALVPVTDELLEDSDAMAAYLPLAMQAAATSKVNAAIVSGPGTGRPLGILKSGCLLTVAKDGSQAAGTIVDANILAMLDRALTPQASIWIANPSAYGRIVNLSAFDSGSGKLAGLPIVTTDACPAPGTPGDLILADMGFYLAALKTPQLNSSVHLWFDADMTAYKLIFRMDGMPALAAPVTPPNASATKSHFVALAVRA